MNQTTSKFYNSAVNNRPQYMRLWEINLTNPLFYSPGPRAEVNNYYLQLNSQNVEIDLLCSK